MTEEKQEYWSVDELVELTDKVQEREVEFREKLVKFQWCELSESEEPKMLVIDDSMPEEERKEAYNCDVTYGTNNEFGFDYLRDNMKFSFEQFVQRELNFAIVDEVDSILIDEARTPLIISGPAEESTLKYNEACKIIPKLR